MTTGVETRRVAIVGASGIGRFHARWWHVEGAEVCGFLGTSAASVHAASAQLDEMFMFRGRGYTDFDEMLGAANPNIIDICSPPATHHDYARRALEADCHVLCEKPFVYDRATPHEKLLSQARSLVSLAQSKDLLLGVCTQYAVGARWFRDLWKRGHPGETLTHFEGRLVVPRKDRLPDPLDVWVDLAPHPLSVLSCVAAGGRLVRGSIETDFTDYEANAAFTLAQPGGQQVQCEIRTRRAAEPAGRLRQVSLNGYPFTVEGCKDAQGHYAAQIATPEGMVERPDMMRALIRAFLEGRAAMPGQAALADLARLLTVLSCAKGDMPA